MHQTMPARKVEVNLSNGKTFAVNLIPSSKEQYAVPPIHPEAKSVFEFLLTNRTKIPSMWAPLGYIIFFLTDDPQHQAVGLVFSHEHWASIHFKKNAIMPDYSYAWIAEIHEVGK